MASPNGGAIPLALHILLPFSLAAHFFSLHSLVRTSAFTAYAGFGSSCDNLLRGPAASWAVGVMAEDDGKKLEQKLHEAGRGCWLEMTK